MLRANTPGQDVAAIVSDVERCAVLRRWPIGALFKAAEKLQSDGDPATAAALYKNWIGCNSDDPLLHAAYFNYSVALAKAGDRFGAINAARECIRLKPDFQEPYINLGRLLEETGQLGEAVAQWRTLITNLGQVTGGAVRNKLAAYQQLGRVLENHQQDGVAEETLKQSLELSAAQPEVIQHWIALRQRQCKWPVVEGWDHAPSATLMAGVSPLSLANLVDDPMFQLARAWKYNRETIKPVANPRLIPTHSPATRRRWGKLRIGYVSSDLREHAVGFAMTDVLETHDRGQFAVSAYYCGINRVDPTRLRIRDSVDSWVDISGMSDEQAAAKIATDEVDILVDLNGYTKDARTRIFAFRPAPIVVNWFGFPGTMATPYHHYIIADEHVIPPGGEIYYSEKVLRLACYQPNDRKRQVSDHRPTRSEEGLPETGVVYCCLNGAQKIIPSVFDSWMTILRETPDSVLWLLGNGDDMEARLKGVAESGGVSPERLVFARKKANPEHLARYVLADLFLDTFPYGAHTTAADAIWMGVPVLTTPGKSFASRVCASLAHAAGIGEFVCPNPESYVARAIELGRDSGQLLKFKQRLAAKRSASLLFDTPRLVRDLEDLYRGMWEEFQQGRLPVPDLANLEIYHEIGVELSLANAAPAADEDYRRTYCDRLGTHNALCPLPPDSRLWKGSVCLSEGKSQ